MRIRKVEDNRLPLHVAKQGTLRVSSLNFIMPNIQSPYHKLENLLGVYDADYNEGKRYILGISCFPLLTNI